MLAAAPAQRESKLDLFCLALDLIAKKEKSVPRTLKDYFDHVLKQAANLSDNPESQNEQILPEAVRLAVQMKFITSLREELRNIQSFDHVSAEQAGEILKLVEKSLVGENRSVHSAG